MRPGTLHPRHLDPQGLVALWREALLARAVPRDETPGYKHHPQLERFKAHASPRLAINAHLAAVHAEATSRGYAFDRGKIGPLRPVAPIPATSGQIGLEWEHLLRKLEVRRPVLFDRWSGLRKPECHPLFHPGPGPVASWERAPVAPSASFVSKPPRHPA